MQGPYAVPADVREAAAPDGDYTGTCASMSDEQLERYLRQAQARVDAVTGSAYSPTNVPDLVVGVVIAMAVYYATLGYRKGKSLDQFHPVYLAYQDATTVLTEIKQGLLDTSPPDDNDPTPIVRPTPRVINPLGSATMFSLRDAGLTIRCGDDDDPFSGPRIDPEEVFGS